MAVRVRTSAISAGRNRLLWPALVLLVLVPTASVLWLTAAATRNARLAMRQTLGEAYHGHLVFARQRVETVLREKLNALEAVSSKEAGRATFARLVRSGVVDSVILYDAEGRLAYPVAFSGATAGLPSSAGHTAGQASSGTHLTAPNTTWSEAETLEFGGRDPARAAEVYAAIATEAHDANEAARARLAQSRCLARAGRRDEAIRVILDMLGAEKFQSAVDSHGRLIVADAELRVLQLASGAMGGLPALASTGADKLPLAPDRLSQTPSVDSHTIAQRLAQRLNDYASPGLPSTQRRFLMRSLRTLAPDMADFSTLRAEELAARYLESRPTPTERSKLCPTRLPGLWRLASADGRVVALLETATVAAFVPAMDSQILPPGASITLFPPEEEGLLSENALSLPAGDLLPGWRIVFAPPQAVIFDQAADAETTLYLWTGTLVVAATTVLALLLGIALHGQIRAARLRNDLVATVSHELKTPLASMRVLVDTLLDDRQFDPAKTREYLQLVAKENLRLSRLIDNFLTFSRMERNRHAFEFEEVAPADVVAMAVEAMRERLHQSACRLDIDVADGLPTVTADRDALVTVLVNLLDNALKYTGEEKHISVRAFVRDDHVQFEVSDNGIGLSRFSARRVFKRFYQVDRRLARARSGCGLGLSIVKFIVADHGGTVRVASRLGHGSTFTVRLPIEKNNS